MRPATPTVRAALVQHKQDDVWLSCVSGVSVFLKLKNYVTQGELQLPWRYEVLPFLWHQRFSWA